MYLVHARDARQYIRTYKKLTILGNILFSFRDKPAGTNMKPCRAIIQEIASYVYGLCGNCACWNRFSCFPIPKLGFIGHSAEGIFWNGVS